MVSHSRRLAAEAWELLEAEADLVTLGGLSVWARCPLLGCTWHGIRCLRSIGRGVHHGRLRPPPRYQGYVVFPDA